MKIDTDFTGLDTHLQTRALNILAEEFYGVNRLEQGKAIFQKGIETGSTFVHCLFSENELIGVSTYNVFSWSRIAPQMYFQAQLIGELSRKVRLRKFAQLLEEGGLTADYEYAFEIAYTAILPDYRGQKLHSQLFRSRLKSIQTSSGRNVVFVLARSIYAGTEIVEIGTNCLLAVERNANGIDEKGKVIITGNWVDMSDFENYTGYNLSELDKFWGSSSTIHLAKKHGFLPIGFSRNFSPVWATDTQRLGQD